MTNNISDYFNSDSVFITGHVNPDGDALGAALALKLYLDSIDPVSYTHLTLPTSQYV